MSSAAPGDGEKDVVVTDIPNFQFRVEGKRGAPYEVSVVGDQITIRKLSTRNVKTGSYKIAEIATFLKNDEIVRRPEITLDLEADRNIGPSLLKKIKKILQERLSIKYNVVEYVQKNYPEEWAAINRDPIKWVLEKSERLFVGGEEYKIAVLHSLVSSRIKKRKMRANLLLVGWGGSGKSALLRSIMGLLPRANWIHHITRLTPEVLAYLDIKNVDGHVFWVEKLNLKHFRNFEDMLTDWEFATWATMKNRKGRLVKREVRIEGIPLLIGATRIFTTSDAYEIPIRMLVLSFEQDYIKSMRYTMKSEGGDYPLSWKLVFYAWLWSRKTAEVTDEVVEAIAKDLERVARYAKSALNGLADLYTQLTVAHAMIYGREKTTLEDFQFVKKNFAWYIKKYFEPENLTWPPKY